MASERPLRRLQVVGALLVLIGLALLAGGVMLVVGGRLAGLPAGRHRLRRVGRAAVAALGRARWSSTPCCWSAMLAWSLWEVGLDWWPLAARLDIVFVFGVLLLLPWFARPLAGPRGAPAACSARRWSCRPSSRSPRACATRTTSTAACRRGRRRAAAAPRATSPTANGTPTAAPAAGQRWSPLAQITPANVGDLQVAWQFRTGDMRGRPGDPEETTDEVTPLKIGSRLYLCTPHQSVIALDATTGAQAWRYDPKMADGPRAAAPDLPRAVVRSPRPTRPRPPRRRRPRASIATSGRALDIAANDGKARADCGAKLFLATADGRLIALDPETGAVCSRFGGGTGQVDLGANMPNLNPGSYYSTSPVGRHEEAGDRRRHGAGQRVDQGGVGRHPRLRHRHRRARVELGLRQPRRHHADRRRRATTRRTRPTAGRSPASTRRWAWSTCRWATSRPTSGAAIAAPAVEKYSSSVVALDLATGQVRWVFQTVHHDLWDYDVPAQPSLVDLDDQRRDRAGAGAADQAGRAVRARSPHRQAAAAGDRGARAAGRRRGRPFGADAAEVGAVVRAAALTGKDMWGGRSSTSWCAASSSTSCATTAASRRRRRRAR